MKIEGIVTGVNQKDTRYGFMLKTPKWEDWINGNKQCPVKKGEKISLEYNENKGTDGKVWKNYDSHKLLEEATQQTNGYADERKFKNRISALQVAIQMIPENAGTNILTKEAEEIEKWINR